MQTRQGSPSPKQKLSMQTVQALKHVTPSWQDTYTHTVFLSLITSSEHLVHKSHFSYTKYPHLSLYSYPAFQSLPHHYFPKPNQHQSKRC